MSQVRGFYDTYHGHELQHLDAVHAAVRQPAGGVGERAVVFLAGDSSLDNKYWFRDNAPATNGYEEILDPPVSRQDIAYWLNKHIADRGLGPGLAALNCSIEESTLNQRACGALRDQDRFLKEHVRAGDTVVVSVGGNDIALAPAPCTIVNMLALSWCIPKACITNGCSLACPCDDCCCGCGFGCASTGLACPPCLGYFVHLFYTRLASYLRNLTAKTRPKRIVVCMIYFPDEQATGSWADATLAALGYNRDPSHLQAIIQKVFHIAVSSIKIPGCEVVPHPLFEALDGKHTEDYSQRVEPSARGGKKMAAAILDVVLKAEGAGGPPALSSETMTRPYQAEDGAMERTPGTASTAEVAVAGVDDLNAPLRKRVK